ncbi:MAG: CARDB domain-containing protein [Halanaerobiaceae bacterium]
MVKIKKTGNWKLSIIVLAISILLILSACFGGGDEEKVYYDVTFTVVDSGSAPLANAKVIIDDETKYTDSNGLIQFTDLTGEKEYTVSKTGYVEVNDTITSGTNTVEVTLELVDTTPPAVNITAPESGDVLGEDEVTVEWTITDDSPYTWELYLGGATNPRATGDQDDSHSYTFNPADIFESYYGGVIFRVEAVDEQDYEGSDAVSVIIETRADLIFGDNGNGYWWDIDNGNLIIYVVNDGPSTAGESVVKVNFNNGDKIEYIDTPSLEAGESVQLPGVEMPTPGGGDNIDFEVILDVNDEVDESNENNNEDSDFLVT